MRQLLLAAGVLCAAGGVVRWATAQNPQTMPGQVVGSGFKFNPVGQPLIPVGSQVGSPVGQPINMPADTPFMRRADLSKPFDAFRGTNLDPKSVIAPLPGLENQNALEKFYEKLKSAIGLNTRPPLPAPTNVTPGIFRRNRERAEERMWRRD